MRALVVAVALAAGCAPSLPSSYHCATDAQCTSSGLQGRCEPNGACAFPDASCSDGYRYGDLGPPGIAGACVGAAGDLGSGGGGGGGGGGGDGGTVGGSITRVGTSTLPASSRSIVPVQPPAGGLVGGDFVLVSIYLVNPNVGITPPSGFVLHAELRGVLGNEFHAAWYSHFVVASEPPAWVFQLSASSGSTAAAVAYRGVDGTAPIDVAAQQQFEAASLIAPSITTTHANDMLVTSFVQAATGSLAWSAPTGMQIAVDDGAVGIFDATQTAAGATGDKQAAIGPVGVPNVGAVD
ncbi:MAG TPA: hypothetical protein VF997_01765, partial [Polyangia bacterium]